MSNFFDAYLPIIVLYALGAYFLLDTKDFTEDALRYPQYLAYILLVLSTFLLGATVLKKIRAGRSSDSPSPRRFVIVLCSALLYVPSVWFFGFLIASMVFCPVTALILGYPHKRRAFLVSGVIVTAVYLGFRFLLKVPLPTLTIAGMSL
ncbi:MAG: tripartite tricarboxylate transporter TctB [Dethiosulfovibrio peptidovorans]|nr:MAG: tripartite tricarboxylate transporter TctB [Dethiosulfovibrio peptidovorans]